MSFAEYLAHQLELHPAARVEDVVKLCYQAAFGAEHLLSDLDAARKYFDAEYQRTPASDEPLCETISEGVCRVNLGAWKASGMPEDWLFGMFAASAKPVSGGEALFRELLAQATAVIEGGVAANVHPTTWEHFVEQYLAGGIRAIHHSEDYRRAEKPAYRVVSRDYGQLLPVLAKIADVKTEGSVGVIAIDGRAASGKSTLAARLGEIIGAGVVHMDDFFLPPTLRSKERLDSPGGNVHYERFREEVLPRLREREGFRYGRFDCGVMAMNGHRPVAASEWRIVEGSYSHHPAFGDYADLKIFCHVDPEEQLRRIVARNGEAMAQMFSNRWIPMEERYIKHFGIDRGAALLLDGSAQILRGIVPVIY